ncbi:unnamed protein product [Eruca vesicaria subsp. sativa]|uniref:Uncharacterized protein n=1 Tax=Eruca vesicaria subsp. sativa TaxID=29727 RepID=A0ABC8J3Q8_ERUVS|nr:unnamed protein product [Eruca vesicaria subsp. sativa]
MQLNGELRRDEYLSVQHILNLAKHNKLLDCDWTVDELKSLVILQEEGFILDSDCPFTYELRDPASYLTDSTCQFRAPNIEVLLVEDDVKVESMLPLILAELEDGPLACLVLMYPSYSSKSKKIDHLYKPTSAEFEAYEEDRINDVDCAIELHTIFLLGDGVDRYGRHYLEFQDSLGDIDIGDRGFIRVAAELNYVQEFRCGLQFY